MTFQNAKHRNRVGYFRKNSKSYIIEDMAKYEACCYLLTAFDDVWLIAKDGIMFTGICFEDINLTDCGIVPYTFIKCAYDIIYGTDHISIFDIFANDDITKEHQKVIVEAIKLSRKERG